MTSFLRPCSAPALNRYFRFASALDKADFLYVCPSHLTDRNFASSLTPPTPIVSGAAGEPTKEQITAVVAEYEAKKSKNKAESSENKDKDKSEKGKDGADVASAYLTPTASSSAPAGPTHNVYALHRDFYAMRLAELRKRENLSKVRR